MFVGGGGLIGGRGAKNEDGGALFCLNIASKLTGNFHTTRLYCVLHSCP